MADKRQRFIDAFAVIRDQLLAHFAAQGMPQDAYDWFKRNLEYNVPGGKLNRGISVTDTAEILHGAPLSEEQYFRAAVLGWCVELLQAFFLVSDDMMDQSPTRRGQPCWYRLPNVGNIAINDAFMLEAAIYHLLKAHFRQDSFYVDLLELFQETTYQTEMGQLIDLITAPEDHVDLSKFSLEKHRLIVLYKTAYYSFYLPVALAMRLSGLTAPAQYTTAQHILLPLGEYFQVQDDYLDCFGHDIGKIGTDIVDNKCSWLVNTALALASPEQRAVLDGAYGRKDAGCEERVKGVYREMGLEERYRVYEEEAYKRISGMIAQVEEGEGGLKRAVFTSFLEKIYRRKK